MIPILHAAGHMAYARSTRRYLDSMKSLPEIMSPEQFQQFTKDGYFTIRRKDKFWSGNFTDQTIEQFLMRMLKAPGGLAHGRGITPATQAKLIHVYPRCIPIVNAIEDFCNVHTHNSEQHNDLRSSCTARDSKDYMLILNWLQQHSPFAYLAVDGLVSISTGIVAGEAANADKAYEVGKAVAQSLTGQSHACVKLKRKDSVISISAVNNTAIVRGQEVKLNSTLLFMRMTCVIKSDKEMKEYLQHEFCRYPPALFDKGMMRKGVKSILAQVLKEKVTPLSLVPAVNNPYYIVDGGYMLHSVPWPKADCTYKDVCNVYVDYVVRNRGGSSNCTVIFDGYDDTTYSTKLAEQDRRAAKNMAATVVFSPDTVVKTKQTEFLSSRSNKARLIKELMNQLNKNNVLCSQSRADADHMIAHVPLHSAALLDRTIISVGNDTDLLVMLIDKVTPNTKLHMQFSSNPDVIFSIDQIQQSISVVLKSHLLILHAFTGCDNVSAIYNIGKRKAVSVLNAIPSDDLQCLDVFIDKDASHEDVAKAGEFLMLKLYGAKRASSLDDYRHVMYMQRVSRKSLTSDGFLLESLPPTSPAAKLNSYRAYFAVQEWLGNDNIIATDWGWDLFHGRLSPTQTERVVAPERVLKIVSCGGKVACTKRCKCRKAGLYCTPMCSSCIGQTCTNCDSSDD